MKIVDVKPTFHTQFNTDIDRASDIINKTVDDCAGGNSDNREKKSAAYFA